MNLKFKEIMLNKRLMKSIYLNYNRNYAVELIISPSNFSYNDLKFRLM